MEQIFTLFLLGLLSNSPPATQALNSGTQRETLNEMRVQGSQILSTTFKVNPGAASERLVQNIVKLEKEVAGIANAKGATAKAKDDSIKALVSSILNLDSLAKGALATYWAEFGKKQMPTKADQSRYVKVFKQLVEENYLEKARAYVGGKYQIVLTEESKGTGGQTLIMGHIKKTDVDLELRFDMSSIAGQWQVTDIQLDQTSLQATYRGSFNSIIKKKGSFKTGFPEIMKAMEKRLKELKKGRATSI